MKDKNSMMASLRAHKVKEVEGTGAALAVVLMDPRIGVDS
jgi:hypothetical protein